MRIGQGIDVHRFSEDPHRPLVLGGVVIEGARGLGGHSDADAVCHALADAVLGAVGLGDLGRHFPDTDPVWEGADSVALLTEVVRMAAEAGFACANADCTIVADTPRLAPHTAGHGGPAARRARRTGVGQGDPGRGARGARPGRGHRLPRRRLDGAGVSRRPPRPAPHRAALRRPGARGRPGQPAHRTRRSRPEARASSGGDQVEGRRAVLELLASGAARCAASCWPRTRTPRPSWTALSSWPGRLRVPVETVPRARLDAQARTEAPQGVLALARPLEPVPLEDLCRGGPARHRAVPAGGRRHHRPAQPGRPAAQRRVCRRHRCRAAAAPLGPAVAHGGQDGGRGDRAPALRRGRRRARRARASCASSACGRSAWPARRTQSLYDLPLGEGPVALVVGSEEKGLAPLVRRRCDAVVAIPQHGTLPSLNVGVAGAVACFEVARQRAARRGPARADAAADRLGPPTDGPGRRRHLGGAEGAATRRHRDVAQALGARARLGLGLLLRQQVQALHQRVQRHHDGEEDDGRHDEERQQRVEERAVLELRVVDREVEVRRSPACRRWRR